MSYHTSATTTTTSSTTAQRQAAPAGYHYMPDGSLMLNSEMSGSTSQNISGLVITSFDMDLSSITASGETRKFSIQGSEGATFRLTIQNGDKAFYNFKTGIFGSESAYGDITMNTSTYTGYIKFPVVAEDDHYDIRLFATKDTRHVSYNEIRFGDGSININSTTGSNSLLMTKVIYQYTDLTLTINLYSTSGAIAGTPVNDTIAVSAGVGLTEAVAFSTTFTVANDKALRIIKQPTHFDVLAFISPVVGTEPVFIPGENIYPAITTAANSASEGGTTVNGSSTGTTVTTHVVSSTIATIGDRVLGNAALAAKTVTVTAISSGSGKTFTISEAISIADDLPLTFSNQMNYRWPVTNYAHVLKSGFIFVAGSGSLVEDSVLAKYSDTTTVFAGTDLEKVYINYEAEAVDTLSLKPTITKGEISIQAGAITFDKQQPLALAGATLKAGGYGRNEILRAHGYDVVFTDLAIALTPVTTTTTAASAGGSSTSVVLASMNGILNSVSTVSGIGIDPAVVDPTVASGAGSAGAGTVVLSAAQSLESGATLTFANTGLVATVTGNIQVLKAGTASQTLRIDIEKLLTIT